MFFLCAVVIMSSCLLNAAAPTTAVQRMIGALRQRDITTSFHILSSLQTIDFNAVVENEKDQDTPRQHAPIFDQLSRVSVPTQITLLDDPQFILTLLAIPAGFSFPLHSRPGVTLYGGTRLS